MPTTAIPTRYIDPTTIECIEVEVTAGGGYVRVGTGGRTTQRSPGASTHLIYSESSGPGEAVSIQVTPPHGNVTRADTLSAELVEATGPGVRVTETNRTCDVSCPGGSGGN